MPKYEIGETIENRWKVEDFAEGGMGVVYFCLDTQTFDLRVALKTFSGEVRSMDYKEFVEESKMYARIGSHAHIAEHYSVKMIGGDRFICSEWVQGSSSIGPDLSEWILAKRLPIPKALDIGIQVCEALRHLQAKLPGFVHCDLKPSNVLVTADGVAKLTDFGLSRSDDREPYLTGGSPVYMAPEQWRETSLSVRTDVYSFGCLIFEIVTGQRLFDAMSRSELREMHLNARPGRLTDLAQSLPSGLSGLIGRAIEKNPLRRPENFDELQSELESICARVTGIEYQPPPTRPTLMDAVAQAWSLDGTGQHGLAEKLLSSVPDGRRNYAFWSALGNVQTNLGDPRSSLDSFERALADIDSASSSERGRVASAISHSLCWVGHGRALRELGDFEGSKVSLDNALVIAPNNPVAHLERAVLVKDRFGDHHAIREYLRAASYGDSFMLWYNLGNCYRRIGNFSSAVESYQKAIIKDPASFEAWHNRGISLRRLRRYPEAVEHLRSALELNPEYVPSRESVGSIYGQAGIWDFALDAFEKVAEIDPGNSRAMDVVRMLEQRGNGARFGRDWTNRLATTEQLARFSELREFVVGAILNPNSSTANPKEILVWALSTDLDHEVPATSSNLNERAALFWRSVLGSRIQLAESALFVLGFGAGILFAQADEDQLLQLIDEA